MVVELPVIIGCTVAAPQAPWLAIVTFAELPDLQFARRSSHTLLYVMPFDPHTGANIFVQAISHLDSLGFGALVAGEPDAGGARVTPAPGVDGAGVAPLLPEPPHSPSEALTRFAVGFSHRATASVHAFEYVFPSEPHSGVKSEEHTCVHFDELAAGVGAEVVGTGAEVPDAGAGVCGSGSGVVLAPAPHSPSATFVMRVCGFWH